MRHLPLESVGEWLALGAYALLTAVFTAVGVLVEALGVVHLAAGDLDVGLWLVYFGALGLFAGVYVFGYGRLLPELLGRLRA